jgi:FixJ family two-component response regulator
MSKPFKIAIIDDDASVRRALIRLVNSAGMEAVAFEGAGEFLDDSVRGQMDCVVTDLRMPGLDGIGLQEKLGQELPDVSVVFLSGHGKVSTSVRAMKAGAVDFLEKPVEDESLLASIVRGAERSRQLRTARKELENLQERLDSLTPRERQVFVLVTSGLLNKQVGAELGAAEKTIKVHRARVLQKMGAGSLAELVRMAQRLGIDPLKSALRSR